MDLSTDYMGLRLRSPLVASPSPLTEKIDDVRRLEDAGIGAVVLFSLFEEQLTLKDEALSQFLAQGGDYGQTVSFLSEQGHFQFNPLGYLEHIRKAKEAVRVPVIASLNGSPHPHWVHYAKLVEQAGADAVELNLYFIPTDSTVSAASVEASYIDTLAAIKSVLKIPVAMKLNPYFTNLSQTARRFDRAGVDALVLFNRFFQPDIDLDTMRVKPRLYLSTRQDLRLPLRWIAILGGRLKADLAATGGIQSGTDAVKAILVGAAVAQVCTVLLRDGIGSLSRIEDGLSTWMESREYTSLSQARGLMSQMNCKNPSAFERAQYMKTLDSYDPEQPDPGTEDWTLS